MGVGAGAVEDVVSGGGPRAGRGPAAVSRRFPAQGELRSAYAGKRIFVTGHTGFKGSWLTLWLADLGAEVTGYSLPPPTTPSLFDSAGVGSACRSITADIRDAARLAKAVREAEPHLIVHLAAQALVRVSHEEPLATLETNVLGTAHVLEAVRLAGRPCAVVIVSSDKCYEDREPIHGYCESDPVGGRDVYSMSKGAAELAITAWRSSFFDPARMAQHGVAIASARAGNVVGGGDWARDRLVPDAIAALASNRAVSIRNPENVRPFQHVVEPLAGYLLLGARLMGEDAAAFAEAWNFGPRPEDARSVRQAVEALLGAWGSGRWVHEPDAQGPPEAHLLRLRIDKARERLGWEPRWDFRETFERTVAWYRAHDAGASPDELAALCRRQIREYLA